MCVCVCVCVCVCDVCVGIAGGDSHICACVPCNRGDLHTTFLSIITVYRKKQYEEVDVAIGSS